MARSFNEDHVDQILALVKDELRSAVAANAPMASAHEGWAVIYEELDELWDEVKKRHPNKAAMFGEAVQTGAMAVRFIHDVMYDMLNDGIPY